MSKTDFNGFRQPKDNFFRLPNEWTDITHDINNIAELKVIEYLLRHTWGYGEFDGESKKISLDEFQNGRKRKDGSRMDKGTGLCRTSVIEGLKKAVKNGYIKMKVDNRDAARPARYYCLNMADECAQTSSTESKPIQANSTESIPRGTESIPRTEKDTTPFLNQKGVEKRNTPLSPLPGEERSSVIGGRFFSYGEGYEEAAEEDYPARAAFDLIKALEAHKRFVGRRRPNPPSWIRTFRDFLASGEVTEAEFDKVLRWYIANMGGNWVPIADAATTFIEKFVKIQDRMKWQENPRGGDEVESKDAKLKAHYQKMMESWNVKE